MNPVIEEFTEKERLLEQIRELKARNFHPGFDNMDLKAAALWLDLNHSRLAAEIRNGKYEPMPALGFYMAKSSGGRRTLSRLTALDTILQMSLLNSLNSVCEKKFSDHSFAYRRGRGVAGAVRIFIDHAQHYDFAAKVDVVSCFDNMDWDVLESALEDFLEDRQLSRLLMKMGKTPVIAEGELLPREKGILQGSPVSGLLCNIYYHGLDTALEERGAAFIRYADDLVLFSESVEAIQQEYDFVKAYLEDRMHLTLNSRKCLIAAPEKLRYLGYKFRRDKHGLIALESAVETVSAYYHWNETKLKDNHRRTDILSSGILRQHGFSIQFESETGKAIIPAGATDIINIYSNVIFASGFLNTAMRTGTLINVFDRQNNLLGSFIPNAPLCSPRLTYDQLMAYFDSKQRTDLARAFLRSSIHHSVLNIRYYNRHRSDQNFQEALQTIETLDREVKKASDVDELLVLEARIRKEYYGCCDAFLKSQEFEFKARTRRPPENEFNAMLSFGNTVLYNLTAVEINKSALDVRIGFLHATNDRLESLNLDIAEIFKPLLIDRTIFSLINLGSIHTDHFFREGKSVYLNEEGKHIFLSSFYEKLGSRIRIGEKHLTYRQLIREEVYKLVRHFREGTPYKAFWQVR